MLKKLNSFTNTQVVMFMLYFVVLTYVCSYLFIKYNDSIACTGNVCTAELSATICAAGGLLLAFVLSFTTLYWMTGAKTTTRKATKKTTKKRK